MAMLPAGHIVVKLWTTRYIPEMYSGGSMIEICVQAGSSAPNQIVSATNAACSSYSNATWKRVT